MAPKKKLNKKINPAVAVAAPPVPELSRSDKEWEIRNCFKRQPSGGWGAKDLEYYFSTLGLEVKPASQLTDAEIDLIYNDLKQARMI